MEKQDFNHGFITGKIAELIFEMMLKDAGRFTVVRFGYEYTIPQIAQYQHKAKVKKVLDNIRNTPDFILISNEKMEESNLEVHTVEVKYRTSPNKKELVEIAEKMLETWDPSWLFVASPKGFFFTPCNDIVENKGNMWPLSDKWVEPSLKAKYLELLNDFELGHEHPRLVESIE